MNLKVFGVISVLLLLGGLLTFTYDSQIDPSPLRTTTSSEPCQTPLTYRIGNIDQGFDITKQELKDIMKEVEMLWATALDRDLLKYSEDGNVAINLIYGEEQQRTKAEQKFSNRIQVKKKQIQVFEKEYNRLAENFKTKREAFQNTVSEYNKLAESFNELASKWRGKNTPPNVQDKLRKMEQQVKQMKSEINREQQNLESLRKRTNAKSRQLNALIEEQNKMIDQYNERFDDPQKFNQGRYVKLGKDERINIYQFGNRAELKTVLAHEAGHAMGLGHVDNPESIMNAMMGEQNIFDLTLTDEDIAAIQAQCND